MVKTNQPTIIITGAGGFLGQQLVKHFASKRWQVRALVRQAERYAPQSSVEYIEFDLTRPFADTLFKGADYLVHAAYIKHNPQHPDAMQLNVAAAERLVKAARQHKLKRSIFISTMSAHADAVSVYGRQKLTIEKLFRGTACTVLRLGLIIGDGGIVKQMSEFMRSKHVVPLVGGGTQPLQTIAASDVVMVMEKVLVENISGTYTVATEKIYSYKGFYQALARQLGVRVLFVPLPFPLLLGIIRFINALHLPLAISADNALGLKKLQAVDTTTDLRRLGVKLLPLETALQQSNL